MLTQHQAAITIQTKMFCIRYFFPTVTMYVIYVLPILKRILVFLCFWSQFQISIGTKFPNLKHIIFINHLLTGDGNILESNEMMRYVEPFSASPDDPKHPMLVLVYRQPGRVEFEEYQRGWSPSIGSSRYNQSKKMIINTLHRGLRI